jgi:hypothetical protein
MKEFEPSRQFIAKVMKEVRAIEAAQSQKALPQHVLFASPLATYAVSAAGAFLGIANLIRMYATIFSPTVCR